MKQVLLVTTFLLALALTLLVGVRTYQSQNITLSLNRIVDVGISAESTLSSSPRNLPAPAPSSLAIAARVVTHLQTPMLYLAAIALAVGLCALAFIAWDNQRYAEPMRIEAQHNSREFNL